MTTPRFEWDPAKGRENERKHGVSFEEALTAFFDDDARIIADDGHSEVEERFVLLGRSFREEVLIVVHCYRDGETIRLISARQATKREWAQYAGFLS